MISTIESNVKLRGEKLAKIDFLKNVKSNKTLERPKKLRFTGPVFSQIKLVASSSFE